MTTPHPAPCTCPACLDRIEASYAALGDDERVASAPLFGLRAKLVDDMRPTIAALRESRALAEKRREALVALVVFAEHARGCASYDQDQDGMRIGRRCTCGLDAARKLAEEAIRG